MLYLWYTSGVMLIDVPIEDDRKLEKVVPAYLKGKKKTTVRVLWAIYQLTSRGNGKPTQQKPEQSNASTE